MIIDTFSHKVFKTSSNKTEVLYKLFESKYPGFKDINGSLASPCTHDFTVDDWWKLYNLSIEQFIQEMGLSGLVTKHNIWCNIYTNGTGLPKHDHGTIQWIGMHFVKLKQTHPQTVFYESDSSENKMILDVKEGDVLIIPGSLFHKVPANELNDVRITSVFAFSLEG